MALNVLNLHNSPYERLVYLMYWHRVLKRQKQQLIDDKLSASEQGHLDAWHYAYERVTTSLNQIEALLDADYLNEVSLHL